MSEETFIMTSPADEKVRGWIREKLSKENLSSNEIMRIDLLMEEHFRELSDNSDDKNNFNLTVSVKKRFGNILVRMSAKGKEYAPLLYNFSSEKIDDNSDLFFRYKIFCEYRNSLRYFYNNGNNTVVISIRALRKKTSKPFLINKELKRTLIGFAAGVSGGLIVKYSASPTVAEWIESSIIDPLQSIFIHALLMVIAPMVFFAVIDGIMGISDIAYLKKTGKTLIFFSLTKLTFYVAAGLFVGHLIGGMPDLLPMLAEDSSFSGEELSLIDMVVNIVPKSCVAPFYDNNILQILFLAVFVGILITFSEHNTGWGRAWINFFNWLMMEMTGFINKTIPFLVAVSMAELMFHTGIKGLAPYLSLLAAVALGLIGAIILDGVFAAILGKVSPIPFIKKLIEYIPLPFALSHSTACLPSTMRFCRKRLGIKSEQTKFLIPVGMQINMDGTAFYVAVVSMMLAETFGVDLDADFLLSFGIAQVFMALTGVGLIIMPPLFAAAGIPETAVTHFIGVEPILDMFGTAQSVSGNVASAFAVAGLEDKVDLDVYKEA